MNIYIGKPNLQTIDGKARLSASIKAGDDEFSLWYEVEEAYSKYLVTERSDSFVVALLPWAMMTAKKLDTKITVVCQAPLSAKLYHQLVNYYIPVLCNSIVYYSGVQVEAEISDTLLPCEGAVGTGVSGGVDSSYTIAKYTDTSLRVNRLTHLASYNIGIYNGYESEEEKWLQAKAKKIASDVGLEPVLLTSNVCRELYKAAHAPIVPAVFISAALSLQKLFKVYYYSSAFIASDFYMSQEDAAYYDLLNVHCLSTENTSFYSSGIETTRLEKVEYISNKEFTGDNLYVCLNIAKGGGNCNRCAKCSRTMAELEVLGKLDSYRNVFDVDEFRKNKAYHWGYIVLKRKSDAFCMEISDLYLQKHKKFPVSVYLAAFSKWLKRGFTTVNKARRRVEDEIR